MASALQNNLTLCITEETPHVPALRVAYPGVSLMTVQLHEALGRATLTGGKAGGCDGLLLPRVQYDVLKSQRGSCDLRIAETVLRDNAAAGWVTNRFSPCVQQAFEWALTGLEEDGVVDRLYERWLPQWRACGAKAQHRVGDLPSAGKDGAASASTVNWTADTTETVAGATFNWTVWAGATQAAVRDGG
jgi:hypothetical protein